MATQHKTGVVAHAMDEKARDGRYLPGSRETPADLSADRLKVTDCVRQYYREFGTVPPVRMVVRRTGLSLRRLRTLFPEGYAAHRLQ